MLSFKVGKVCLAEEKDAGDVECKIETDDIRISDVIKELVDATDEGQFQLMSGRKSHRWQLSVHAAAGTSFV